MAAVWITGPGTRQLAGMCQLQLPKAPRQGLAGPQAAHASKMLGLEAANSSCPRPRAKALQDPKQPRPVVPAQPPQRHQLSLLRQLQLPKSQRQGLAGPQAAHTSKMLGLEGAVCDKIS
jgi:hypothetical protein